MSAPDAKTVAIREGMEAKRSGKPRRNPYAASDGKPIAMLREFHRWWTVGYDNATSIQKGSR